MSDAAPERFYLVDGPSYFYRAYHAIGHLSTSRGLPTNATLGMTMMLWKILREDRPSYMGIAWDAPGPTFRHQQFEAYKLQRPGMPKDLVEQIPWVRRSFEALGLPFLEAPGYEADDILATAARRLQDTSIELVLVTADKDALQLVDPRVTVLSVLGRTGERIVYDAAKVEEKWGVPPARIPDVLALMGDSIDNIPGVPGVGEVTAQKLLREFGSLEAVYANLAVVTGPKLRETLARHRDQAFLSRQLAVLEGALPIEIDPERFRVREPDWERLRALWTELEFTSLLRQVPARAVTLPTGTVPVVDAAGWREFLGRAGERVAVEPVLTGSPPDLTLHGVAAYAPAAGACYHAGWPALPAGLRLIGHDTKALVAWTRGAGVALGCGARRHGGRRVPPQLGAERLSARPALRRRREPGHPGPAREPPRRGSGRRRRPGEGRGLDGRAGRGRVAPRRGPGAPARRARPPEPLRDARGAARPRPRRHGAGRASGWTPSGWPRSRRSSTRSWTRSSARSTSWPASRSTRTRRSSSPPCCSRS